MVNIEHLFTNNPYCLKAKEKRQIFSELLWKLTLEHKRRCQPYKRILESLPVLLSSAGNLEDIPMLPVALFKTCELRSVSGDSIVGILTSSGTTSQVPSHIFMDKETAALEANAFRSVTKSFIGEKKYPMILVDCPGAAQDKAILSIRGAALRLMSDVGRAHLFLLDDAMNIKWKELEIFLKKYRGERIILFGFTFMIWQHLYRPFVEKRYRLDLDDSIIIHTGGWKKLEEIAVDNETFKRKLNEQLGIKRIYNFYAMTELIGVIFLECEKNHLHAPDFADVIVRDPTSLKPLPKGHKGLIQVLSLLPRSYPGHSLLTEDLGTILGEDDCPCGWKGKYFKLHGRMPSAELRGCSDTYAYNYENRRRH